MVGNAILTTPDKPSPTDMCPTRSPTLLVLFKSAIKLKNNLNIYTFIKSIEISLELGCFIRPALKDVLRQVWTLFHQVASF
jgi:hypothetical protein